MSQIRAINQAFEALDQDFSWRIQELSEIKTSARSAVGTRRKMLVRAGVALLYAHWEGFIKNSSQVYLEFVANQRFKYQELQVCFIIFGLRRELETLTTSKKSTQYIKALEFLMNEMGARSQLSHRDAINTESNLSSLVFQNIAISVGIDTSPYTTKFNLIDESLLKRRNKIAHGEFLDIDAEEYSDLSNEVVSLMRMYKDDIQNALILKLYLATTE